VTAPVKLLAGTAALSGTFLPMAMADTPNGGSSTAASSDECQSYNGAYTHAIWVAGDALAAGDLVRGLEYAGYAAGAQQLASERGC
jgi:hypothetical protein